MQLERLIGDTPLVEVLNINPNPQVKIYCKLEGQNPGGSVKDRAAYNMISEAVKRGDIKPGMKLIEATSGNTGIALAKITYKEVEESGEQNSFDYYLTLVFEYDEDQWKLIFDQNTLIRSEK